MNIEAFIASYPASILIAAVILLVIVVLVIDARLNQMRPEDEE